MKSAGGKVAVLAKIPAQPGKRDGRRRASSRWFDSAVEDRGRARSLYLLHEDTKDPDVL